MKVKFTARATNHYQWMAKFKPKLSAKIDVLIDDIILTPYQGIGKPEPLKHEYAGCWSRRIDGEHRLVYRVEDDLIIIVQCRFHYTEH